MASYWTRKDDQSGETTTVYPWQEEIGGGDKEFKKKKAMSCTEDKTPPHKP